MDTASSFRKVLEDCDVAGARALWAVVSPHLPQPKDDSEALATLHVARTQAESVSFDKRAYSHAWLTERGLPSHLPDELRPRAERIYPVIVDAVGISVGFTNPYLQPAAEIIKDVMSASVSESYADGRKDPGFVKGRMMEARDLEMQKLFGAIKLPKHMRKKGS
jgi:hypothetical protein